MSFGLVFVVLVVAAAPAAYDTGPGILEAAADAEVEAVAQTEVLQ